MVSQPGSTQTGADSSDLTNDLANDSVEKSEAARSYRNLVPLVLLALAVLAYAFYFSYLTITRYAAFEARALDMGNLVQAIWNTAQGNWFHLTNQPGIVNRLSLHVEPIIIPISWLYRLHSTPETLLILQSTVIALGALPVFALGRLKLRNDWLALIFAVSFLLNPSIQGANWLEFHPVALAPTFLLAAFYFLFAGKVGWYALFAVLAASCKEEISLLVFMVGLYAWLSLGRRKLGWITMALSMAWALLAVFGIQNLLAAGNIHWDRYGYLGESPAEMLQTLLLQPGTVFAQLSQANALQYVLLLMLPVAFTSLLAPEVLLLSLPSLAINLLADYPPMHQITGLFYAAPIVPFVIVSGIVGVERLDRWLDNRSSTSGDVGRQRRVVGRLVVGGAIIVGTLTAQSLYGYLPGSGNYRLFPVTERHRRAVDLIAQIPPDAKLSAQDRLNPHVAQRETVYIFPRIDDADTVFVDVAGPAWPQHPNDVYTTINDLLENGFGVATAADGYLLLSQDAEGQEIPAEFYDRWIVDDEAVDGAPGMSKPLLFDETVALVGHDVVTDQHGELVTQLYWQALQPIEEELRFYVAYLDADGVVLMDSIFYPPVASLWYPTSAWDPGQTVLVETLPWTLENDQFTLAVGLYRGEEGWQNGGRLTIAGDSSDIPLLENGTLARLGGYERSSSQGWQSVEIENNAAAGPLPVALFGNTIRLEEATLVNDTQSPGESVDFVLSWQAKESIPFDYSVFAHLVDAEGNKVAQLDWQPRDALGPLPMTSWPVGMQIVDRVALQLPETVPSGDYRLIIGVYDWRDGTRLAVSDSSEDTVTIADIHVR